MKLHIVSDLHLEFGNPFVPTEPADVLILAGDIHISVKGLEKWLGDGGILGRYENILYVTGNHEYYYTPMEKAHEELADLEERCPNFQWLNNNSRRIKDIEFFGGTMWTDTRNLDSMDKLRIEHGMNDFNLIYKDGEQWNLGMADSEHFTFTAKLDEFFEASSGCKKVVVSHHLPTFQAIGHRYAGNTLNAAWAEDMETYMPNVDLWVFGHSHVSYDEEINGCRVVSNAYGYHKHGTNKNFNPNFIVEI